MAEPNKQSLLSAQRLERWAMLVAVGIIGWFYLWTVDPTGEQPAFSREADGYYNLLTQGFLKGQLSLDMPVDPMLATLKNPYDPTERAGHGLHDASYFKGRYFLYFGVTPVIVLFAPVRLLTGWFIEERFASLVFAWAGFLLSVAVLRHIRRHWFESAPRWLGIAGVFALGLSTMVPPMLRRPSIWEVSISCAYALFMAALFCVLRAIVGNRPRLWTVLASLAMGLCIGARPNYIGAAVVLLAPLIYVGPRFPGWQNRGRWAMLACGLGPIACVGTGLAAYNYLRFGNLLEFGQSYQMGGDTLGTVKSFSPSYILDNVRIYLLAPAGLSPFFPFITVISAPAAPTGSIFGMEDPYGLLPNMPWVVLALAAVAQVFWPRAVPGGRAAKIFYAATSASGAAAMLTLFSYIGANGRYMVDFTPVFVLLGGVGAMWLITSGPRWWRVVSSLGAVTLLGWSAAFGLLASLQHNDLLRAEHPAVYMRVAQTFNRVAQWLVPVRPTEIGPVELRLEFPQNAVGQIEPLVATGREFRADYVFVHYLAADAVRFGFEHTSRGGATGPPVKVVPGAVHTVRVTMGSLYPPRAHPYFDALSASEVRDRTRTLRVWLDGQVVLQRTMETYDATEFIPSIGTSGGRPGFKRDFSGKLIGWRRVPDDLPARTVLQTGPLRLRVKLPPFTGRHSEPILSSGETGKGDLVYLTYEDARHVSFGHDHWGLGGAQSAAIELDPDTEHSIELFCPPLLGPNAPNGLRLRLDGREVFTTTEAFYPCEADSVSISANEIMASTASMFFSGEVLSAERIQP